MSLGCGKANTGSYAGCVGRVGALALALGIGTALVGLGTAHADTGAGADSSPSATSSQGGSATGGTGRPARVPSSSPGRTTSARDVRSSRSVAGADSAAQPPRAAAARAAVPNRDSTSANADPVVAPPARAISSQVATAAAEAPAAAATAAAPAAANSVVSAPDLSGAWSALENLVHSIKLPAPPPTPQLLMTLLAWTRRELESLFGFTAASAGGPVAYSETITATDAAATGTTTVTIEAETMTVAPAKAGSTFSDVAASGRKALLLSTNSTASKTLSLPSSTSLVIRARGDQYNGAPTMTVSIDGKVVATTSVTSTTWADYTVPVSLAAGQHTISIAFTNDLRQSAAKDRNLRLDKITVVAGATNPSTQAPPYFQAADWLWKPIPSNPVLATNSATWVSYLAAAGAKHVTNLYEYGVTLVPSSAITSSTPRYDVTFTEPWGSDPVGSYTVPIPLGTKVPTGSDGQIAVLDPTTGKAFGIWQAKYNSATNTWSGAWGGVTDLNGNGVDQSGSATGTNIARYAGVVTAAEFTTALAANSGINHALFISSNLAGSLFTGPATKSDGTNMAGVAVPIPEGTRIQLDPSLDVDAIPGLTAAEKVIAKTLQTYGAYVGDQGGAAMAVSFELVSDATSAMNPGAVWSNAGLSWDYYDMSKIPWSKLRVLANWDGSAGA